MKLAITDGSYGSHERNKFDLFSADSVQPSPLVIYIHGGGFTDGSKERTLPGDDRGKYLQHGISYAAINYPFLQHKALQNIMMDIARAVQYFKYHAEEFHIDKERVCCYGGSAGAGASLFLASSPDFADRNSADPVLRESTKLYAAGLYNTQSTYDLYQWPELLDIPMEQMMEFQQKMNDPLSVFYGTPIRQAGDFLREDIVKLRQFLDMAGHVSHSTCPLYIESSVPEDDTEDVLHSQIFSRTVYDIAVKKGVLAKLSTPEAPGGVESFADFLCHLLDRSGFPS